MRITILGASGRVGQIVTRLALEAGHEVVAVVHHRNPFTPQPQLTTMQGELSDKDFVGSAFEGSEAVISTLGSWGTKDKNTLSQAMKTVVPAMMAANIRRLISLTGAAALLDSDRPSPLDRVNRWLLMLIAPKILRDAEAHARVLQASSLDWTILRSPVMSNGARPNYRLSLALAPPWLRVTRAGVAHCLLDELTDSQFIKQAPIIYPSKT